MIKRSVFTLLLCIFFSISAPAVLAERPVGESCGPSYPTDPKEPCEGKDYDCLVEVPVPGYDKTYSCQKSPISATFGKIQPPPAIAGLLKGDPTGAGAISKFLSNFVTLIYSVAAIVLIFMILWGAFDWMTSGGDKEKLANAQKKILNAFIGIILLAVAFAVIAVLGTFTGFKFFEGQYPVKKIYKDADGTVPYIICLDGTIITGNNVSEADCQGHEKK